MATTEDVQHRENNNNLKDIDHDDQQSEANTISDQLFRLGVTFTSNRLGQYVVRKIDRLLWVIENTAKWSVPQNITESENSVPPPSLIRPLNWFLFIPALIVMRLFRAGASIALIIWGCDALAPITVVHILQKQRRILRAVRYQGLKTIRTRNAENKQSAKKGLLSGLTSFVSGVICTRGSLEEPIQIVIKSNSRAEGHVSKKRLLSDEEDCNKDGENDLNLTCADLLVKYGSILSCDDSDFEPETVDDDDDTSTDLGEESEHDSGEESEPEGRTGKDEIDEEVEEEAVMAKEAEEIQETKTSNISEPVEIIQNNNNYCNEYKKESYPATLYGSNPEDKFYSPIESPVPPEDQIHCATNDSEDTHQKSPVPTEDHKHTAATRHDSGDSQQSNTKFFHNQPHNFNHNQPPRSVSNSFNLHYQYNSHQPSQQNHNYSSFNPGGFLAHEKSFGEQHHSLSHHLNGGNNTKLHESVIHTVPPPSSLSPTSSTSSSTTNVSSAQASSTTTDNVPPIKHVKKYSKLQKNRYFSKQNSKKNSY